jgi:uncharacterized Rossmann fold enzyme
MRWFKREAPFVHDMTVQDITLYFTNGNTMLLHGGFCQGDRAVAILHGDGSSSVFLIDALRGWKFSEGHA